MKKMIVINSCKGCDFRVDASNKHVTPIWRNIYCEHSSLATSITVEDDEIGFPPWCPLEDYNG